MSVVEPAKAFEETIDEAFASIRSVSELVPIEVINTRWNDDVLEDIERRRQALNEVVEKIVVGISAVMKVCAKGRLPFLSL